MLRSRARTSLVAAIRGRCRCRSRSIARPPGRRVDPVSLYLGCVIRSPDVASLLCEARARIVDKREVDRAFNLYFVHQRGLCAAVGFSAGRITSTGLLAGYSRKGKQVEDDAEIPEDQTGVPVIDPADQVSFLPPNADGSEQ